MLAIAMIAAVVLASALAYLFSPIGAVPEPREGDLLGFAAAFAINGAVVASVALAIAGRRSWGVEIGIAMGSMLAAIAILACLALWAAPWMLRSRMDAWAFLRLRQSVLDTGRALLTFHAPLGAVVGAAVGAVLGRWIIFGRRRPRVAGWIGIGLLMGLSFEPIRAIGSGLVWF